MSWVAELYLQSLKRVWPWVFAYLKHVTIHGNMNWKSVPNAGWLAISNHVRQCPWSPCMSGSVDVQLLFLSPAAMLPGGWSEPYPAGRPSPQASSSSFCAWVSMKTGDRLYTRRVYACRCMLLCVAGHRRAVWRHCVFLIGFRELRVWVSW